MSLPKEMLSIAEHIIELKLEDFDPVYLEDRYRTASVAMLKVKSATVPPHAAPAAPSQKNVIDLMAMLKKSLQFERPASEKGLKRRAAAAVSRTGGAKRSKSRSRIDAKPGLQRAEYVFSATGCSIAKERTALRPT